MKITVNKSYNFLIPYDVPMTRVGTEGNGGYVIAKSSLNATGLVALSNNDSFINHWSALKPQNVIHVYDGVNSQGAVRHYQEDVTAKNIDIVLERAGEHPFIVLDIATEKDSLVPELAKSKTLIGMVITFHNLDFESRRNQLKASVDCLNDNYKVVHVHANNNSGVTDENLPYTLEVSFLRNEYCTSSNKRYDTYLQHIDSPNALTTEEIMLNFEAGDE